MPAQYKIIQIFKTQNSKTSVSLMVMIALCLLFIGSCSTSGPSVLPAPPVNTTNKLPLAHWDKKTEGHMWTKYTSDAIDQHGANLISVVPKDAALYCSSFKTLDQKNRRAFWIHLISALAKYESNYDPGVKFDETTVDPKMLTRDGKPIFSRGLLQISKESANGYGCGISDAQQLHDPNINISCAVRILDRWIGKDKVISDRVKGKWRGAARYFSPFRNAAKISLMQSLGSKLSFCQ